MKAILAFLASAVLATAAPNVVVIMVDDMGYSDLGCYGGEIDTPHIDRLAANGLRFTQFYNCGRCCPTTSSATRPSSPTLTTSISAVAVASTRPLAIAKVSAVYSPVVTLEGSSIRAW